MKVRFDSSHGTGRPIRILVLGGALLAGALLSSRLSDSALANPCPDVSCGNTVTILPGFAEYMSLVLDSPGDPVISYMGSNLELRVLHCGNADCSTGNQTSSPDSRASYISSALDSAGFPVISYYYAPTGDLRIMHCNDPNCSGGDESIASPDGAADVGQHSSLALDTAGNPVVSYYDNTNADLKVLHCGTPTCSSGNVVNTPDSVGSVGTSSAIALDAAGNPVVGYVDQGGFDVRLLHCNDPNCSPGGDSATSPDTVGDVGPYLSLRLDATGNPVLAYRDFTHFDLRLLHCGNPNCTSGDSLASPDTGGAVGSFTSLVLDAAGNPVISYWDASQLRLKVLHCGNQNCTAHNKVAAPDDDLQMTVGQFTSVALDGDGKPIVAYTRSTATGLGVVHCADVNCGANDFDGDGCQDAEEDMTAAGTEFGGGRRDPKNPWDYFNPTGDGMNRIDDVLAVVEQYYQYEFLPSPPSPPNTPNPAYTARTDRTYIGPNFWNLGPPNGRQNVDDIIAAINSYMHDCF